MVSIVAGLLMCGLQHRQEVVRSGNDDLYVQYELKTIFRVDGRLVLTNVPGEDGLPMRMQMVVLKGPNARVMKSMSDFRSHVSIAGPNQALQFCRIRTSIEHPYMLDEWSMYELLTPNQLDADLMFGDARSASFFKASHGPGPTYADMGFAGIVNPNWVRQNHLGPARVEPDAAGWKITRYVIAETSFNFGETRQLTEKVGRDGSYTASWIVLKKVHSPFGGHWYFPKEE